MSVSRLSRHGALVVALYLVAVLATMRLAGHHVRPLFEGIGPVAPYQWVDPPPEFAAGNTPPKPAEVDTVLDATGSKAAGPSTPDGQLVLALPAGSVAARAPDTAFRTTLTPLAPKALGALPAGLRANGNAYRVELAYEPSATPITTLAKSGNVILVVPEPATTVYTSPDGKAWTALETQQVGGAASTTVGAQLTGPGYFVAAAPEAAPAVGAGGNDAGSVVAVAAATAALALVIGLGPFAVRRLRARRS